MPAVVRRYTRQAKEGRESSYGPGGLTRSAGFGIFVGGRPVFPVALAVKPSPMSPKPAAILSVSGEVFGSESRSLASSGKIRASPPKTPHTLVGHDHLAFRS